MTEVQYLIDTNALLALGLHRRESSTFRTRCHVTADVAHEAGRRWPESAPQIAVTHQILARMTEVLATLVPGESDLLDLYANKGRADPVLVATALVMQERSGQTLFPEQWAIATSDLGVRGCAEAHGIEWIDPAALKELIDRSEPEPDPLA